MTDTTVAKTILEQLGGRRFIAMTGSKEFTASPTGLTFRLTRNNRSATHMRITLTAGDDYNVELLRCWRTMGPKTLETREGIYCDQLQEVFTSLTGLYTSLGTMGRCA